MNYTNKEFGVMLTRLHMPYQVHASTTTDTWWATNRDYKPLGTDWIPQQNHMVIERQYEYLSDEYVDEYLRWVPYPTPFEEGEETHSFWLYNDGNVPWRSKLHLNEYLDKYKRLRTLELRSTFIFDDHNLVIGVENRHLF